MNSQHGDSLDDDSLDFFQTPELMSEQFIFKDKKGRTGVHFLVVILYQRIHYAVFQQEPGSPPFTERMNDSILSSFMIFVYQHALHTFEGEKC